MRSTGCSCWLWEFWGKKGFDLAFENSDLLLKLGVANPDCRTLLVQRESLAKVPGSLALSCSDKKPVELAFLLNSDVSHT